MRVLIDTNVLISAALSPNGAPFQAGDKDFLESGVKNPAIMTPAEFLKY